MTSENLITIFTALGFGPGVAIVLLRWVLNRAAAKEDRVEQYAAEIATLRARVEKLEGSDRETLAKRIEDSRTTEASLAESVERIAKTADRLAERLDNRTCQLPSDVLCKVQELMRGRASPPLPRRESDV